MTDVDQQIRVLTAGAATCVTEAELRRKLALGRPLKVKLGIDPTAPDIHLGFAVVLRKLRQFQDLGHKAVLILGDFTARVGDPSGRSKTRPQLSTQQIDDNVHTYIDQVRKILRFDGPLVEVHRNSAWLSVLDMEQVLRLTAKTTVAQILERDDFAKRFAAGDPIALLELLYPLMQGLDSVQVEADVELGGTDQLFNNLMGRDLQKAENREPQVVLTMPLLEGLDGTQKMSKSLGNYVGITEPPDQQFGKLMSLPDHLMPKYFDLTTGWDPAQVAQTKQALESGDLKPVDAKRLLARTVVGLYHGRPAAAEAEASFDRVFKAHGAPANIREAEVLEWPNRKEIAQLLAEAELVKSNNEGRRMIEQGAVRIGGEPVAPGSEMEVDEVDGKVFQVGKRKWARIRVR